MRAFIVPTPFKVLVFSTLLALFLMAMLWGLMQLAAGNPFGAMAANGEVRFVNQQEGALANQEIRLLCFQGVLDTNPTDMQFVSAADGTMPVALPAGCTHLAALHLWHVQPTSKPGHGPAYLGLYHKLEAWLKRPHRHRRQQHNHRHHPRHPDIGSL